MHPSAPSHPWQPRRIGTMALTVVLLAAGVARAGGTSGAICPVRPVSDVVYFESKEADPRRHKLDLFLPKDQKDFPVVFFVHGGAWQRGDKSFLGVYEALGTFLARHGIGAVVINYRLSPAVRHPEHILDVARAFAWTHKHIAEYGGRPDRLFVCGHSAGGHLVALLATDPEWLKGVGLSLSAIRGVIAISGVYDLSEIPRVFVSRVFGNGPDVVTAASPTRQARAGLAPFLILYADHDLPGCDQKPAEAFARALRDKGNQVEAREITGSNHYFMLLNTVVAGNPVCDAMLSFISAHSDAP